MNNKYLGVGILIVVLLGGFMLFKNKALNTQQNSQNSKTITTNTQQSQVAVTASGFNPQTLTIKAGTRVVWVNQSGSNVTVNSDTHPTHLLWPFLNLGEFNNGSSVSVIFEKAGTYTYHNHLNISQKGTVIVQ